MFQYLQFGFILSTVQVTNLIGLRETWYFGLSYVDAAGTQAWLSMEKKVSLFFAHLVTVRSKTSFLHIHLIYLTKILHKSNGNNLCDSSIMHHFKEAHAGLVLRQLPWIQSIRQRVHFVGSACVQCAIPPTFTACVSKDCQLAIDSGRRPLCSANAMTCHVWCPLVTVENQV